MYGSRIRVAPNTVLFCDPQAHTDIYSYKSNVQRSKFYTAFQRDDRDKTTLNTVDIAEHAFKRKLINLAFTEKSVRAAADFVIQHTDRWNQLLVDGKDESKWSDAIDISEKIDALVFDIMGDLCFGASFDIKEPGENPWKDVPHNIVDYMKLYYSASLPPIGVDSMTTTNISSRSAARPFWTCWYGSSLVA